MNVDYNKVSQYLFLPEGGSTFYFIVYCIASSVIRGHKMKSSAFPLQTVERTQKGGEVNS